MSFKSKERMEKVFQNSMFDVWKFHFIFYLLVAFTFGLGSLILTYINIFNDIVFLFKFELIILGVFAAITIMSFGIILISKARVYFGISIKYSILGLFLLKTKVLYIPGVFLILTSAYEFYNVFPEFSISYLYTLIPGAIYLLFIYYTMIKIKSSGIRSQFREAAKDN